MKPEAPAKASTNQPDAAKPQRDALGRMLPGNAIGAKGGRPRGPTWTDILREECDPEKQRLIIRDQVQKAINHPDWRCQESARDWIFANLAAHIHAAMKAAMAEIGEMHEVPMEDRVRTLVESAISHAEDTGTPAAAMQALKALESGVNAVKAARSAELTRAVGGEWDLSRLSPEQLAQLQSLALVATGKKPEPVEPEKAKG